GLAALITNWLALPGYVFLALIQMIVIPLVVASIILGMASSDSMASLRSTGIRAGLFFVVTTLAAVLIGMVVALTIQPGLYLDAASIQAELKPAVEAAEAVPAPGLAIQDLPARLSEMIPANPLKAGLEQNMMQVVVFAILIGVALVSLPRAQQQPLLSLLASIQEITMVVVRWAMLLVPFAVFGLLAQITTRLGIEALLGMGLYVVTVIIGLILVLIMYLIIYRLRTGRPVGKFLSAIRDAQLLAFSTSSSAAVMPLTMQTAEARLGVSASTTRFVIPLGTTINMAGTALYQMVATLFLAQVFGVDIGIAGLLLVVFLAVGASIGSPGTPGIGIVILSMLLGSVGIPAAGIALIIGVDRILDMCRTTVNVTGDLVAASVLDRPEGGDH
ncbi:dicarboxylate/amino acid:cation symporter, partial [Natronospira sp.]